jgi:phage terminase large subunit-like protein
MPCAVGIDMSQKIDLTSAVVGFRLPLGDEPAEPVEVLAEDEASGQLVKRTLSLDYRVVLLPAFWLPEETLTERVKQDRVPYDLWARDGQLTPVDGAIIGAEPIVKYIAGEDGKSGLLARFPRLKQAQFAYDPAFATEAALALRDRHHLTTVEVPQNYTHLSEACQVFEALVKAKRIIHGGHRLLRWNVENVAVKRDDAGRIRPVKPRRAGKRIDGVVAAIMAISRLMLLPPSKPKRTAVAKVWTPEGWRPA